MSTVIDNYGRILERAWVGLNQFLQRGFIFGRGFLSKAEMLYAYNTLLEWNALRIVLIGDKTFKLVQLPGASSP